MSGPHKRPPSSPLKGATPTKRHATSDQHRAASPADATAQSGPDPEQFPPLSPFTYRNPAVRNATATYSDRTNKPCDMATFTEIISDIRAHVSAQAALLCEQSKEIAHLRNLIKDLSSQSTTPSPHATMHMTPPKAPKEARIPNPSPRNDPLPAPKLPHRNRQWKECAPPQNPLRRYSDRRLILDKALPTEKQRSGQRIVDLINIEIAQRNGHQDTSIDAMVYSRNGRPIAIASKGLKAEELLPHTDIIAKMCYDSPSGVVAYPDRQLFRVKLNGVRTRDQYKQDIPIDQILKHLGEANDVPLPLHDPPTWIKPVTQQTHSTLVFSFRSREDATAFLSYRDFIVSGERCRASAYKDHPPTDTRRHRVAKDTTGTTIPSTPSTKTDSRLPERGPMET